MKNIIITPVRLKKEGIILLACFLASVGLNIYAISKYKTDWSELISQLPIVIGITFLIYFLVLLFRLVFLGIAKLIQKN
jgi:transposase